jgi:hypothetical protein
MVTDSTESPFSDKLMMYHTVVLTAIGLGNYGLAVSASPRRDLVTQYTCLASEIGLYDEDGANIMIDHGWMEQPPQSINRYKLAKNNTD